MPPIVITNYDPAWAGRGLAIAAQVKAAAGPLALYAEHIGSTSIPEMAAKPVFDLQVTVADLARVEEEFGRPLSLLGFELMPYRSDHVPAGYDDPPELWVKRMWRRRGHTEPDVNLHIRVAGSGNERLALLFRDWFRAHPEAVPGYARFKVDLARATGDLEPYTEVKDSVVDMVVAIAESWAAETGWAPHTSFRQRAGEAEGGQDAVVDEAGDR
jgi:GrpB-like predicted nucleotidyltransferase (UPF0157 family)